MNLFTGSLAFVHLSCLERWLNQSGRDTCELCTFRFEAEQTRRYSVYQGLRIWYKHPRHLSQLRADLVIGLVLTGVTLGLCSICIGGMKYFVLEGFRVGISYVWTEGVISFFLTVIILGYFTTIYLMVRDHIVPWYHWWNRCVNVRLILDMDMIPAIDPPCIINASTETLMVRSHTNVNRQKVIESEMNSEITQNQNTIILIPDLSSTSVNVTSPPPVAPQVPRNSSIPSVMSAVMSHIINTTIDHQAIVSQQQKSSKDNIDKFENQSRFPEIDSKNVIPGSGNSVVNTMRVTAAPATIPPPDLPVESSLSSESNQSKVIQIVQETDL